MEPLVEVDQKANEYVPKLAESWEFKGKEWVFKLKKGIKFHDGSPLTAHDVEFSFNRIKTDKKSLQRRQLRELEEMRVVDDHTIVLVTKTPNVVFLDKLQSRFVMSKAAAERLGKDVDKHPIGTGPYKFVELQARRRPGARAQRRLLGLAEAAGQDHGVAQGDGGSGTGRGPGGRAGGRHQRRAAPRSGAP